MAEFSLVFPLNSMLNQISLTLCLSLARSFDIFLPILFMILISISRLDSLPFAFVCSVFFFFFKLVWSVGCHKIAFHLVRRSQTKTEMRYAIYRKRQKTHCHFNKLLLFETNSLWWIFNGQFVVLFARLVSFIKRVRHNNQYKTHKYVFSYNEMAIYRQNKNKFSHRHRSQLHFCTH